jgi:hypothetical protein
MLPAVWPVDRPPTISRQESAHQARHVRMVLVAVVQEFVATKQVVVLLKTVYQIATRQRHAARVTIRPLLAALLTSVARSMATVRV